MLFLTINLGSSKLPISFFLYLIPNYANSVVGLKDILKFGRINYWSGNPSGSTWGISSIFGGGDNRIASKESFTNKSYIEPVHSMEQSLSMIHLREVYIIFPVSAAEFSNIFPLICLIYSNKYLLMFFKPPTILRPTEGHSEQEAVEIAVTKLLLRSYYDIVRKNIEDSIPKAIMHFLVFSSSSFVISGEILFYWYVHHVFIIIEQLWVGGCVSSNMWLICNTFHSTGIWKLRLRMFLRPHINFHILNVN